MVDPLMKILTLFGTNTFRFLRAPNLITASDAVAMRNEIASMVLQLDPKGLFPHVRSDARSARILGSLAVAAFVDNNVSNCKNFLSKALVVYAVTQQGVDFVLSELHSAHGGGILMDIMKQCLEFRTRSGYSV